MKIRIENFDYNGKHHQYIELKVETKYNNLNEYADKVHDAFYEILNNQKANSFERVVISGKFDWED